MRLPNASRAFIDHRKLADFIRAAAVREDAAPEAADEYGQLFVQEAELTLSGASARVRIVWIVRREEDFPRLVSCYIVNA